MSKKTCKNCKGTGTVAERVLPGVSGAFRVKKCPKCKGKRKR